jgi:hypothetical protein
MFLIGRQIILGERWRGRAFRLAQGAVDALVGIDDQKIRSFVEAVHRTDFHAVGVLALDAVFGNDKSHGQSPEKAGNTGTLS